MDIVSSLEMEIRREIKDTVPLVEIRKEIQSLGYCIFVGNNKGDTVFRHAPFALMFLLFFAQPSKVTE